MRPGAPIDLLGDLDRRLTGLDPATARADVDLDQAFDRDPVFLRRGRQIVDVGEIVDADQHAGAGRQRRKALDLLGRGDLVRDENVAHPAAHHRLGFADLLAADAAGAALLRQVGRDVRRFVALGVAAVANSVLLYELRHLRDVSLERVEVEEQARRVDLFDGHADAGGDVDAHVRTPWLGFEKLLRHPRQLVQVDIATRHV